MRYIISNSNTSICYEKINKPIIRNLFKLNDKEKLYVNTLFNDRFNIKFKKNGNIIKCKNKSFIAKNKIILCCYYKKESRFYIINKYSYEELKYGLRFVFNKKQLNDKLLSFSVIDL